MMTIKNLKQLKSLLKILNCSYFSYDGNNEISIISSIMSLKINGILDLPKGSFNISNTEKCFDFIPFTESKTSFIPNMYFTLSKKEISDIIPFLDKNGTIKSTYCPTQDLYIFAESEKESFFYASNRVMLIRGKVSTVLNKSLERYKILIPQNFIKVCKFFKSPSYDFTVSGNYIHLSNGGSIVFNMELNDAEKYPRVSNVIPFKLKAGNFIRCNFDTEALENASKNIVKSKEVKEKQGIFLALEGKVFLNQDQVGICAEIFPNGPINFSFNVDYFLICLKTIGNFDINIYKSNASYSIAYAKNYTVLIMPMKIKPEKEINL